MKILTPTILGLFLVSIFFSCKTKEIKKSEIEQIPVVSKIANKPFATRLEWTGAKIEDKNYSIWGGSPITGIDGKTHVFVARWPEKNVDPAWRESSEIAHYIADSPEGDYVFSDVAIKGSGNEGAWDRYAPHNPEIKKIGDYYAIVYIANDDYHQPPHPANQKIGLVYSKSLFGPWIKAGQDGMVVEVSSDSNHWTYGSGLGVDNPCLNEINGKPVIYFKNRNTKNGIITAKYGYATAETLAGPYTMSDTPITDNQSYLEDATTFTWNTKYYLLTTDNHGTVTGVKGGGILWSSDDWKKFNVSNTELAYETIPSYYADFDVNKANKFYGSTAKFQRPKVLMIAGKPCYLFVPSGWNIEGGDRTVCYVLKIKE